MADMFLVGCGAGFSGDRIDAPIAVVDTLIERGLPSALMFEVLGERTLALAQLDRRRNPDRGYEPMLEQLLAPILRKCADHHIPIVGNFGAASPINAARLIALMAKEEGIPNLRIAAIEGDDMRGDIRLDELEVWEGEANFDIGGREVIAANVYLGAEPIQEAMRGGADVVVTGRCADPSLALAPLAHHFGWRPDDWDRMAAGTLAGHLLECGSQVTGGYFGDPGYKDVPDPANIGFPIAEVSPDGVFVVTKAVRTGGVVNRRTVKEQILYEMHEPDSYLTPDVTLDITGVSVEEAGADRVRVTGSRGRPRPDRLKATVSVDGGWLGEGEISYAGPNAAGRARLAAETLIDRLRMLGITEKRRIDLIGVASLLDSDDGAIRGGLAFDDAGDVRVRLALASESRLTAERAAREVLALYCCGPAGGGGVRWTVTQRINTVSYLVPRDMVRPTVTFV